MTVIVSSVSQADHDVSATSGGPFNAEVNTPSLHFGFHKSGAKQRPRFKFGSVTIPKGSTINSAEIDNTVSTIGGSGSFSADIILLDRDGLWDPAGPVGDQWNLMAGPTDWRVQLLDAAASLVEVGTAAGARSGSTDLDGDNGTRLQRFAQVVDVVTAGTVTSVNVALGNSFTPATGTLHVELWSVAGGVPNALLATSDTRPVSDIAPKLFAQVRPEYNFVFSAPEQIAVSIGQDVAVVLRGDFVGGVGVHLGTSSFNYLPGDISGFGIGVGFDRQNYIGVGDWQAIASLGSVAWTPIPIALGSLVTPSLTVLVQTWIDDPGYTGDVDGFIGFGYDPTGTGTGITNHIAAANHATDPAAELTIDFTEPPQQRRRVRLSS